MARELLLDDLTDFMPLVSFYTIWKHQKIRGTRGISEDEWHKMVLVRNQELDSSLFLNYMFTYFFLDSLFFSFKNCLPDDIFWRYQEKIWKVIKRNETQEVKILKA